MFLKELNESRPSQKIVKGQKSEPKEKKSTKKKAAIDEKRLGILGSLLETIKKSIKGLIADIAPSLFKEKASVKPKEEKTEAKASFENPKPIEFTSPSVVKPHLEAFKQIAESIHNDCKVEIDSEKQAVVVKNQTDGELFRQNTFGIDFDPSKGEALKAAAKQAVNSYPNGVMVNAANPNQAEKMVIALINQQMPLENIQVNQKGKLVKASELYPELKEKVKKEKVKKEKAEEERVAIDSML